MTDWGNGRLGYVAQKQYQVSLAGKTIKVAWNSEPFDRFTNRMKNGGDDYAGKL